MKKYLKWIISFICLVIFVFIAINVYNGNVMDSDGIIYGFINEYFINDRVTPVIKVITGIGDTICIVIITIICFIIFRDKKINLSIIINLIISVILNNLLKIIFMRPRPNINVLVQENTYSFPSGHSMISLAFYGYLIYLIYYYVSNKNLKWGLICLLSIVIFLIGFSRIYLGVHYVTDVIGGFCFSIAYLIVYISIYKKIIK